MLWINDHSYEWHLVMYENGDHSYELILFIVWYFDHGYEMPLIMGEKIGHSYEIHWSCDHGWHIHVIMTVIMTPMTGVKSWSTWWVWRVWRQNAKAFSASFHSWEVFLANSASNGAACIVCQPSFVGNYSEKYFSMPWELRNTFLASCKNMIFLY